MRALSDGAHAVPEVAVPAHDERRDRLCCPGEAIIALVYNSPRTSPLQKQHDCSRLRDFQRALQTQLKKGDCGAQRAAELLLRHLNATELRSVCNAEGKRVQASVPLYDVQMRAWDRVYRLVVQTMLRHQGEGEPRRLPALLGVSPGHGNACGSEPNLNPRPRSRSKRQLSHRSLRFLHLYFDPASPAFGKRALAAELAGYKRGKRGSNQLDVAAFRVLNHPDFQEAVLIELLKRGCGTQLLAEVLERHAKATKYQVVVNADGKREVVTVDLHNVQVQAFDRLETVFAESGAANQQTDLPPHLGGLPEEGAFTGTAGEVLGEVNTFTRAGRMLLVEAATATINLKRQEEKLSDQQLTVKPTAEPTAGQNG